MIYFFYGNDNKAIRKANATVSMLRIKKPDASFVEIKEDINENTIDHISNSGGLFSVKVLAKINSVINDDNAELIENKLEQLKQSENIFVWYEKKVERKLLDSIKKKAEKFEEFVIKEEKREPYNVFLITDAFGQKKFKEAWLHFVQAKNRNVSAEEIHGALLWQIKSMLISSIAKTAEEVKMSPFVFSKSKKYLDNFSKEKTKEMLNELIYMYDDGHLGNLDFDLALEKFLLRI